jgi:hypothetical protein
MRHMTLYAYTSGMRQKVLAVRFPPFGLLFPNSLSGNGLIYFLHRLRYPGFCFGIDVGGFAPFAYYGRANF